MYLRSQGDIAAVCDELNSVFAAIYGHGSVHPQGGIHVQLFRLVASAPGARPSQLAPSPVGRQGGHAEKASRPVWWRRAGEAVDTPVRERGCLPFGFTIEGPALLEDVDTVVAVSPGWRYELDDRGTGSLRRLD
jgi:N-methylhydantoinase A/oxoprolinase/acetone carboxylase beta subunit